MDETTPQHGARRPTSPSPGAELAREKNYVRKIESRLIALRESGLILSTRDFEIVHDWFERGVPVELVIVSLEEVFAKTADRPEARRVQSIAYCRKAVERAWEERRAALLGTGGADTITAGSGASEAGAAARGSAFTKEQIAAHLSLVAAKTRAAAEGVLRLARPPADALADETRARDEGAPDRARTTLGEIAESLAELADASPARGSRELPALEEDLVALEEKAVAAGRDALAASELDAIGAKAAQDMAGLSARMSAKAREATLRRAVDAAVRRRLALPRYSLFTMTS